MRRLIPAALMAGLLAMPAPAAKSDPDAELARYLEGRTPGPPVDCISLFPSNHSTTIGTTIVYEAGGTRYVNRLGGDCTPMRDDTIIITRTPGNRLCRGDIAQFVTRSPPAIPVGSCSFDSFTPYRKAK